MSESKNGQSNPINLDPKPEGIWTDYSPERGIWTENNTINNANTLGQNPNFNDDLVHEIGNAGLSDVFGGQSHDFHDKSGMPH